MIIYLSELFVQSSRFVRQYVGKVTQKVGGWISQLNFWVDNLSIDQSIDRNSETRFLLSTKK